MMIFQQTVRRNHQAHPILLHKVFLGNLRQKHFLSQVIAAAVAAIMRQKIKMTPGLRVHGIIDLIIIPNDTIKKDMNLANMPDTPMNIALAAEMSGVI